MHAKQLRQVLCNCSPTEAAHVSRDGNACSLSIRTVSHTLEGHLAERLRFVAYRERVSESAVIEFALRGLLSDDDDSDLGSRMRSAGATLRRKVKGS